MSASCFQALKSKDTARQHVASPTSGLLRVDFDQGLIPMNFYLISGPWSVANEFYHPSARSVSPSWYSTVLCRLIHWLGLGNFLDLIKRKVLRCLLGGGRDSHERETGICLSGRPAAYPRSILPQSAMNTNVAFSLYENALTIHHTP